MLAIRDLRQAYGDRTVLALPRWDVGKGEDTLVLGPSGSGKSTLLAIVAGLLTPSAGEVRVAGEEITRMKPVARDLFRARHVGIVPQTLHLIGVVSARDNLRLARSLARLPRDDAWIEECLERLGVARVAGRPAGSLSIGEAQRVAIARALVNRPALVLADEPTSALDDANCAKSVELLASQAAACGATLVIATHDHRLRERFARRLEL